MYFLKDAAELDRNEKRQRKQSRRRVQYHVCRGTIPEISSCQLEFPQNCDKKTV